MQQRSFMKQLRQGCKLDKVDYVLYKNYISYDLSRLVQHVH